MKGILLFSLMKKVTKKSSLNIFKDKIIEQIFFIATPAAALGGHSRRPARKSLS
jgi:hypothetical protein